MTAPTCREEDVPQRATEVAGAWSVLRARQWAHFVLAPAIPLVGELARHPVDAARAYAPAAGVAALCLGYAYGLNAIADRHDDVSASKNPLVRVTRVPPAVAVAVAGCAVAAVVLAAAAPRVHVLPAVLSVFWASLYSVGPRLKRLPLLSTITNCGIFAPLAFLIGDWATAPHFGLLLATFVTLQTQAQLIHEVADRDEDLHAAVHSTAVTWGGRTTLVAAAWLGLAVAVAFLAAGPSSAPRWLAAITVSAAALVLHGGRPADAARLRIRHRRLALGLAALLFAVCAFGA
ncbi:MAG: UbiA family prenyltransferase [bacterium]